MIEPRIGGLYKIIYKNGGERSGSMGMKRDTWLSKHGPSWEFCSRLLIEEPFLLLDRDARNSFKILASERIGWIYIIENEEELVEVKLWPN